MREDKSTYHLEMRGQRERLRTANIDERGQTHIPSRDEETKREAEDTKHR